MIVFAVPAAVGVPMLLWGIVVLSDGPHRDMYRSSRRRLNRVRRKMSRPTR